MITASLPRPLPPPRRAVTSTRPDGVAVDADPDADFRAAGPLNVEDTEGIELLRDLLQRCDYAGPAMFAKLGIGLGRQPGRPDLPLYLRRLREAAPFNGLVKLLYLGTTLREDEAERVFAPVGWRRFQELGLLAEAEEGIRATCAVSGHANLWLTHDRLDLETLAERRDYVLGLNPPARLLAAVTPRGAVRTTLDLGTGCGVQAFLAAAHSERVIATDICPRALHFAAFNTRLNRVGNVEFRLGNLFEPVGGECFDLVVSNPPYVISPGCDYVCRDSGLPGDTICARLVRQVGAHLTEGGLALALANWAHPAEAPDEPWDGPVRRWLAGNGCDAWIIRHETSDPLTYAADWNRQMNADKYGAALDLWQGYFERERIRAVSLGALLLRRRLGGPNWVRSEDTPQGGLDGFGDQVTRLFAAMDFVGQHPTDDALLGTVFRPATDLEVVRTLRPGRGGYEVAQTQVRLRSGFRFEGSLDETGLRLVTLLDGRRTLAEALEVLLAGGGLEPRACREIAARLVRRLVVLGFLVPVEGAAGGGLPSPGGEAGGTSIA